MVAVMAVFVGCAAQRSRGEELSFGPFYNRSKLTLEAGTGTEIFGPLFDREAKDSERAWTFSPLFTFRSDSLADSAELSVVYPLMSYNRFGGEYRFHFLQVLSWAGGDSIQGHTNRRVTVFPFYLQQRSSDSNLNYTAFFPIFGHLKNRLFRDEVDFTLFPLYLRGRKNDVITDNYLFPFIHSRHGDALKGWQFWPLLGSEHKDITTKANSFGDMETVAGHAKEDSPEFWGIEKEFMWSNESWRVVLILD